MCSIVRLPTQLHAAKRQPYSPSLSIENFPCPLKLRRWRTATATHSFEDRGRRGRRAVPSVALRKDLWLLMPRKEGERGREREVRSAYSTLLPAFLPPFLLPPLTFSGSAYNAFRVWERSQVREALPPLPSPSCRVQTDRNREGSEEQERRKN